MKKILLRLSSLLICAGIFGAQKSLGQGTQFTYQGRLDSNGSPTTGSYDLIFGIFTSSNGLGQVGNTVTNLNTGVSNGLFTVALDFGPGIFTGEPLWLGIGVRTSGGTNYAALSPLQPLTPAPYAMFAGAASNLVGTVSASQVSGSLPAAQLTGTDSNPVTFNNGGNTFDGTFYGNFFGASFIGGNFTGAFIGNGSGLAGVNAANSATLNGLSSSNFWQTTGNSNTVPGVNFLGTTDTNALELHANGHRALRIEPDPQGVFAPNLIGGYPSNAVLQPNSVADTIAGGGYSGGFNIIQTNTSGAFIGGGSGNQIGPNVYDSVIAAGKYNTVQSYWSAIGGGYNNYIPSNADYSVIAGGVVNAIQSGAPGSVIGGGWANQIQTNAGYSAIVGGFYNLIGTNAGESFIGGGEYNNIAYVDSVIGGGYGNLITNSYSVIAGGIGNIAGGFLSTVGGGQGNVAIANNSTTLGGLFNTNIGVLSLLGAGGGNSIQFNAYESVLGGGQGNSILSSGYLAFIGSGMTNTNAGGFAFIGGGENNTIQLFAGQSFIGAGFGNTIQTNAYSSFVGGGGVNTVQSNAIFSTVGGGWFNTIMTNAGYSVIEGGQNNTIRTNAMAATIGGGFGNLIAGEGAVIGGGGILAVSNGFVTSAFGNVATGLDSVVPGGAGNRAFGAFSFAAGHLANAYNDGSFVWADAQTNFFNSTANNQFAVRASGGVDFETSGAGVTVDGQTVLAGSLVGGQYDFSSTVDFTSPGNNFDGNGSGLVNVNAATLDGLSAGNFWQTSGNSGTTAGVNFLGTTDNQPLELQVNASRALRLEPNTNGAPNLIAGAPINFVAPGTFGASVAGGGSASLGYTNSVAGNFGFVGGGASNTVQSNATAAAIGGGQGNTSGGQYSTVPGGNANAALGNTSFAAGNRAKANHNGAFVWADSQSADFASTTNDQFSVRAQGGVRFITGGAGVSVDGQSVLAGNVSAGQYSFPSAVNFTNPADSFAGNGSGLTNVNAALLNGLTASNFWQTGGNSGTSAANGNFLGTLDNQPLEVRVNNGRAVRVEPTTNSANLIAGAPVNFVAPGIFGATVAGGGSVSYAGSSYTNSVAGNFGFVGGGAGNAIQSGATVAVIGGGAQNTIQTNAAGAVIGGGLQNTVQANGQTATIAGGYQNVVLPNSVSATIGGGQANTNGGLYSTVPGGNANAALGTMSFAAGNRAKANHMGAFVWADSQTADFPSTTNDQFSVRAQGGVRLNPGTNNVEIASGGIKVTGAGIGTSTAAFIHLSSATNTGGDSTTINNTLCNGDPNAMLFVTHTYNPPGVGANLYNKTVGVWYNGSSWAIYNEDASAMATNITFNVLVIKR